MSSSPPPAPPPRTGNGRGLGWALAAVALLALALRLWGITFGLPFEYHVDEFLYRLTARVSREQIHPHFGPFQILVLSLRWMLLPVLSHLDLPSRIATTVQLPASFELIARWCSAILGAATVIPLFLIGRRLWNDAVGLIAATFLAICFLHARSSHYGVPDATVCFLTVAAAYFCTRLSPRGPLRHYLLAGFLAGLAFPTKQLSWPLFVMIALFHLFPDPPLAEDGAAGRGRRWLGRLFSGRLIAAATVSVVTFLLTSPQVTLHWRATLAFWKFAATLGARGGMDRFQLDPGPHWWFYLESLDWGLGHLLLAASLAGTVLVFARRRPRQILMLLCFPVLYLAFLMTPSNMHFARYSLSAVPFLLLAAADLVWSALGWLRLEGRRRAVAAALATVVLSAQSTEALVRHDLLLGREDTRTLAKRWIEDHIPAGSTVLLESWWFGPQLASAKTSVPFSRRVYTVRLIGPYGLSDRAKAFGPTAGTPTIDEYAEQGVEYIVTNNITSGSHMLDPQEDQAKSDFYRSLDREAVLLRKFSPYRGEFEPPRVFEHTYGPATFLDRMERPGSVIRIYQLRRPAS